MFAKILDAVQSQPLPDGPKKRPARGPRLPLRPRGAPNVPDRHLPELELDRYLNYWALTATEPATATVRGAVFEARLRSLIDRDSRIMALLHPPITSNGMTTGIAARWPGLRLWIHDQIFATWKDSSRPLPHKKRIITLAEFDTALEERLETIPNRDLFDVIAEIGIGHLVDIAGKALRLTAQEQVLATQLKMTARTIRTLESHLTNNTLPPEDLYELKLRRDLFITDLRAYARTMRG